MSTTLRSRTLRATSTWDRGTAPETKNQEKEIHRILTAGWTTFAKYRDIFKGNIGTCLKREVFNTSVLPVMLYGAGMGTHNPSKEQDSSRVNKYRKEYVKHHTPGQKNQHLRKRKYKGIEHVRRRKFDLGRARQQDTR